MTRSPLGPPPPLLSAPAKPRRRACTPLGSASVPRREAGRQAEGRQSSSPGGGAGGHRLRRLLSASTSATSSLPPHPPRRPPTELGRPSRLSLPSAAIAPLAAFPRPRPTGLAPEAALTPARACLARSAGEAPKRSRESGEAPSRLLYGGEAANPRLPRQKSRAPSFPFPGRPCPGNQQAQGGCCEERFRTFRHRRLPSPASLASPAGERGPSPPPPRSRQTNPGRLASSARKEARPTQS